MNIAARRALVLLDAIMTAWDSRAAASSATPGVRKRAQHLDQET
jgi:hypothetical protein